MAARQEPQNVGMCNKSTKQQNKTKQKTQKQKGLSLVSPPSLQSLKIQSLMQESHNTQDFYRL